MTCGTKIPRVWLPLLYFPKEYYLRNLTIPLCDHLSSDFQSRFNSENRKGVGILALLPAVDTGTYFIRAGGGSPKVAKVKKNEKKKRSNSVSDTCNFQEVIVVANEVLTYVSFHFAQCTVESIRVAVLNFYDPGSINEAKRILWDSCAQHLSPY